MKNKKVGKKKKGAPLSKDQIKMIKIYKKEGKSEREIAKILGCARSTVWYWLQRGIGFGSK